MAEGTSGTISPVADYSATSINRLPLDSPGSKVTNRQSLEDLEPVEDGISAIIDFYDLGIQKRMLPEDLKYKLEQILDLTTTFIINEGKDMTFGNFRKQLLELEKDLDLNPDDMAMVKIDKIADKAESLVKLANSYYAPRLKALWGKIVKFENSSDIQDFVMEKLGEYVSAQEQKKAEAQKKLVEKYLKGKQEEDKEESNE
jgi:hypothetical protein